jgi:hypothetical protein
MSDQDNLCECGCNTPTAPGKRFIRGHQLRIKENRVRLNCSAHCTARELRVFALWDGDVGLAADRRVSLREAPARQTFYRWRTEPSGVKRGDLNPIDPASALKVLASRQWPRVRWGVIGLDEVEIVDFLTSEDGEAAFMGFDMFSPGSTRRLTIRRQLSRAEIMRYGIGFLEDSAPGLDAGDCSGWLPLGHDPVVVVLGSCGEHFTGTAAFDAHLVRVDSRINSYGAPEYDLVHLSGIEAGLEVAVEDGHCNLATPAVDGVAVWRLPLASVIASGETG